MKPLSDSGVLPTSNRMGWTADQLNEVSKQFVDYASLCHHPLLDIGAAYGIATIPALERGATIYANDICAEHLTKLQQQTPVDLQKRLKILLGRFPNEINFQPDSFDAIHASNVLHFLSADDVVEGLARMHNWLRPEGRLFVLAATPFQATHSAFIQTFQARKQNGNVWPGWIENIREYNSHWSADLVPPALHVFDEEIISRAVRKAGFTVEKVWLFRRAGLPDFCCYDGRENLGLIARK